MTTYTINEELNGIEITFDGKPDEATRTALKTAGYKWHRVKKLWYAKDTADRRTLAINLANGEEVKTEPVKLTNKVDKDMLRKEFSKAWDSERMIKHCVNSTAQVAILPNDDIVTIDKQSIKTRFCYGESGYDADDACAMANHARTNEDYFKDKNMEYFRTWIRDLESALNDEHYYMLTISTTKFSGQNDDCRLVSINWKRIADILDDLGGSAVISDIVGKEITPKYGFPYRIATKEELSIILEAYKDAETAHEKRIDTYLKKYGMKNVHSWTYWRDA